MPMGMAKTRVRTEELRRWLQAGLALVFSAALLYWLRPYALSIYHLEMGGRALENALVPVYPDRLAPEQITDPVALDAGIIHLHQALRYDPRNVQAQRLLARAYLSLGQPEAALKVLQRARAIRPEHPLLRLELADVYDSLGRTEEAWREYEAGGIGSRVLPLTANYLKSADAQIAWGSGELAIFFWRRALSVDPGNLYALYQLARTHRNLGDEATALQYEERLRHIDPQSLALPLDFRLAEYQAQALIALVDEGTWGHGELIDALSRQAEQTGSELSCLMFAHQLQILLRQWPDDPDLRYFLTQSCN